MMLAVVCGSLERVSNYLRGFSFVANLVRVEDLQESLVDVRLALEAVLDLVDVVDSVVEFHWLVVLDGWSSGGPTERWVELHGRGTRGGIGGDGRIALTARC